MIWSVKVEPKPVEGDLKIEHRFAWWPKRINDKKVWLEKYSILYEWRVRRRMLPYFTGMTEIFYHVFGDWDKVGERIHRGIPFMDNPPPPPNSSKEKLVEWDRFIKQEKKKRYQ